MEGLPFSAASERNKGPILEILRAAFAPVASVLEIGSGTGQHAVHFARHLPHLRWQPTDRAEGLAGLRARVEVEALPNVALPLELDVTMRPWPVDPVDAIYTANTFHIMSWREVQAFFAGLHPTLRANGLLAVYGPFNYEGRPTSPSNAQFDVQLRARAPASGLRDIEAVHELATAQQLRLLADHAMPANNRLVLFGAAGRARSDGTQA